MWATAGQQESTHGLCEGQIMPRAQQELGTEVKWKITYTEAVQDIFSSCSHGK